MFALTFILFSAVGLIFVLAMRYLFEKDGEASEGSRFNRSYFEGLGAGYLMFVIVFMCTLLVSGHLTGYTS